MENSLKSENSIDSKKLIFIKAKEHISANLSTEEEHSETKISKIVFKHTITGKFFQLIFSYLFLINFSLIIL